MLFIYFYIKYYPFYIFVLQRPGSVNEVIFYARGLDQSGWTRGSSSGWSHHPTLRLHRRPTGRIVRLDRLVGLLGAVGRLLGAHFITD